MSHGHAGKYGGGWGSKPGSLLCSAEHKVLNISGKKKIIAVDLLLAKWGSTSSPTPQPHPINKYTYGPGSLHGLHNISKSNCLNKHLHYYEEIP